MRVASAVIGGLGASLGVAKGLLFLLLWLAPVVGGLLKSFDSFVLLGVVTDGAEVVSCALGVAGAGPVVGRQLRAGVRLMLVGVVVIPVAFAVYGFLQPLTQPPDVQPVLPTFPTKVGFYVSWLFPVPLLLIGAILASLARDRAGS